MATWLALLPLASLSAPNAEPTPWDVPCARPEARICPDGYQQTSRGQYKEDLELLAKHGYYRNRKVGMNYVYVPDAADKLVATRRQYCRRCQKAYNPRNVSAKAADLRAEAEMLESLIEVASPPPPSPPPPPPICGPLMSHLFPKGCRAQKSRHPKDKRRIGGGMSFRNKD